MEKNTPNPRPSNGVMVDPTPGNEHPSLATSPASGIRRTSTTRVQSPTQCRQTSCPRFMSFEHAQGITVPTYRPRVERNLLPFPTIDGGVVPTRYSALIEVKGPGPMSKLSKVLSRRSLKKKWESAVKCFDDVNVMEKLDKCVVAMRKGYRHQALEEVKYQPVYRLKEVRRASVMLGSPRTVMPPSPFAESTGDTHSFEQDDAFEASTTNNTRLLELSKSPRPSSSRYSDCTVGEARRMSIVDWPVLARSLETEVKRQSLSVQAPVIVCPLPNLHSQPTSFLELHHSRTSWDSNFLDESSSVSIFSPLRHTFDSFHTSATEVSSLFDSSCESDIHCCDNAEQALAEYKQTLLSYNNRKSNLSDTSSETDFGRLYEDPMPSESVVSGDKSVQSDESVVPAVEEEALEERHIGGLTIADNEERMRSLPRLRARDDRRLSRIPRASPPKSKVLTAENQDKGSPTYARATTEIRSAIPVLARPGQILRTRNRNSVRNVSKESVVDATSTHLDDKPDDAIAVKIAATDTDDESQQGARADSDDISSWDFDDNDSEHHARPCTVFTGEYRSKSLPRGPTLRVAPSAEHVIMGPEDPNLSTSIVTKRSPSRVQCVIGKDIPSEFEGGSPNYATSEDRAHNQTTSKHEPDEKVGSNGKGSPGPSLKHSPCTADSWNQENSVTIFSPVPERKLESCEDSIQVASHAEKADESVTLQTPKKFASSEGQSPATVVKSKSVEDLPATAETPLLIQNEDELGHVVDTAANPEKTNASPEPTFAPRIDIGDDQHDQTDVVPSGARLPDSKSSRMLVGFKNIFLKSRCATDKSEADQSANVVANEQLSMEPNNRETNGTANTEIQIPKAKSKVPKFHGRGSWNRGLGNLNLSFPKRQPEARISSFARPALSAISKVARPSKREPTRDVETDHVLNTSTCNASGHLKYPVRPRRSSSVDISSLFLGHLPTLSGSNVHMANSEKLRRIRVAIDEFCHRARDAHTADGRERSIKIALSLQQSLGEYKVKAKEFKDAERAYFRKRLSRDIERSTLFEFYEQAQSYLNELREE